MKRVQEKIERWINYALIALLSLYRFAVFDKHFTCYDDIKVAQFTDFTTDIFLHKFRMLALEHGDISTKLFNLFWSIFGKIYNYFYYAFNFSKYWTYAPGQFVFTFAFLPFAYDYTSIKFYGRLPSLVFGIIAIIFCWKLVTELFENYWVSFLITLIFGLSWQAILYCMHMSNYEVIITIGFLLLMLVSRYSNANSIRKIILISGFLTWFHYQTVCYVGGVLFLDFVLNIKSREKIVKIIGRELVNGILYLACIFPIFIFFNTNGVITWNAGINNEYVYNFSFNIIYNLKFFVGNFLKVFTAMLTPVSLDNHVINIIIFLYCILFIMGIILGIKKKDKDYRVYYITLFSIGTLLAELFFVIIGKFTLSPTRHCNILIPIFIIQIGIGINILYNKLKNYSKVEFFNSKMMIMVLAILLIGSWCADRATIQEQRRDLFTEKSINELIDRCKPDMIVDVSAGQLWYLLGNRVERKVIARYDVDLYDIDSVTENNNRILFISGCSPIGGDIDMQLVSDLIVENGYLSVEQAETLKGANAVDFSNSQEYVDFDFYNVTNDCANSFCYALYIIE